MIQQKGHVASHQTNLISHSGRVDHLLRVDKATPATQILIVAQAVTHPVRPGSRTSSQARQSHILSDQAVTLTVWPGSLTFSQPKK